MFAMFTVKCGSLRCDGPCERFLWIAAVKRAADVPSVTENESVKLWSHPTFLGGLGAIKLVNGGWFVPSVDSEPEE